MICNPDGGIFLYLCPWVLWLLYLGFGAHICGSPVSIYSLVRLLYPRLMAVVTQREINEVGKDNANASKTSPGLLREAARSIGKKASYARLAKSIEITASRCYTLEMELLIRED